MKRHPILTGVLILSLVALSAGDWYAPTVHTATITVNTSDDELNNDGDCSLREAIQAANTDTAVSGCTAGSGADTITLPPGFYTLTIPGAGEDDNATGDLDITSDLTINGDPGSTIIQGGTNFNNGIDRVLDIHNKTVELNHLWIEYGKTPNTPGEIDGGGIRTSYSTLTLYNSFISSNSADWRGGGIYSSGGTLTLNNTTVGYNNADVGAGIFNQSHTTMTLNSNSVTSNNAYDAGGIRNHGTLTLTDTTVSGNTAEHHGGGVSNSQYGTLTLDNSEVSANTAEEDGGGILNEGTLRLDDSTVTDNTADSDKDLSGDGGGIWNEGPLDIYGSTVTNNDANYGGGIFNQGGITLILSESTVADNGCSYNGGGIYNDNYNAYLVLHRSTISGNDTGLGHGGGIYHKSGELTLDTCTISSNTSGDSGGGIFTAGTLTLGNSTIAYNAADVDGDSSGDGGGIYISSGTAQTKNTIIGDNSDWHPQRPDCWGTLTSQGYNLLENTTGCSFTPTTGDITGSDPKLSNLSDNGGPTWTHALQSGSPAIDWIPDGINGCLAGVSTDQRSYLRAGGVGYGGSLCDIGAYEYNTAPRLVQFSAATYNVNEGAGPAIISVSLTPASGSTVTVDYATSDGTAQAGSDYTAQSGTLTFNPGITTRTISVPILDDELDEADETVTLTLSDPTNATIGGTNPATLTIEDNDPLPTVGFSGATYTINEGAGSATITVNLNTASGRLVEVDSATSDGTATAGSDYTTTVEQIYFYPGDTSSTFTIPISDDGQNESNETVILTLSDAANAVIGGSNPVTLTIVDNDGFLIHLPLTMRDGSFQ